MSAQSINRNGNGRKPINLQAITSVLTGNPLPLFIQYITGRVKEQHPITPDTHLQAQPTPALNLGRDDKSGDGAWPSPGETLRRAEQAGYEFGLAGGLALTVVSDADKELLADKARADAAISLRPKFDPQQNAGDAELAEALAKHKTALADLEKRLIFVKDTLLKAENEAARVPGPLRERPGAPQSYIAAASILIALLPFLTIRDLMVSGASDDPVFVTAVAFAAALVIGFVSTYGLFQVPPLKAGEGRLKAWQLAAGLSLSLFAVRLSFASSWLLSLGFGAFEFCAVSLVEHFAARHRLSAYEWDATRQEKQEKLDLVSVASARAREVERQIHEEEAEIQRRTDDLSLRELQAHSPQEWESKVIATYHIGYARAVAENKARQQAEQARLAAEDDRLKRI